MFKQCNGLNSKCFLLTYLVIVGFLLILWANRIPLVQNETRQIPRALQPYLISSPQDMTSSSVTSNNKLVLTSDIFIDKWSFVYFTHSHCLPSCQHSFNVLSQLEAALQVADIQFALVDLDTSSHPSLPSGLQQLATNMRLEQKVIIETDKVTTEQLATEFNALFLRTDYADGSYQIEQEHVIFVVDPKGRIYAHFVPPYNFELIRDTFILLRQFYASSE